MLTRLVLFCAFSLFTLQSVSANLLESLEVLHSELVRICEDLVQQTRTSRIEFWFFKESQFPWFAEELIELLVVSEPIARYPKLLLDENCGFDASRAGEPTLVFVFLGSSGQGTYLEATVNQLLRINTETRLVVVFSYDSMDQFSKIRDLFRGVRLLNVLYVTVHAESHRYEMFILVFFRSWVQVIQRYESLQQIFPEQIELEGNSLGVCTHRIPNYSELDATNGQPRGLDVQLVNVIIGHMNGTLNIVFIECLPGEEYSECTERRVSPVNCLFNFARWDLFTIEYGVPALPFNTEVLIVPRGRPYTFPELLTAPYTPGLWLLIVIVSVVRGCVNLLSTHLSKKLKTNWKQTLKTMISLGQCIFTFLLVNAYEAKIVSFLANWPFKADVTTFEELRAEGIRVLMLTYLQLEEITDPRLTGIVQPIVTTLKFDIFTLAPKTAIVAGSEFAKVILQKSRNYEHKTSRTRFVVLEERVESKLMFYYFGYRSVLMHRFGTLLRYLYEAGIDRHWLNMEVATPEYSSSDESSTRMITFEQLLHWGLVFMCLWMLSVILFCLEISYSRFKMLWHKVRNIKIRPAPVSRRKAQT